MPDPLATVLKELLTADAHAVLATSGPNGPRASLMACAPDEDGRTLLIATSIRSAKYRNLSTDPRVSLLLDDRKTASSPSTTRALTLTGEVTALTVRDASRAAHVLAQWHPHLKAFLADQDTVLLAFVPRQALFLDGPTAAHPLPVDE